MTTIRIEHLLSEAIGCFFLTMAYCLNHIILKNDKNAGVLGPLALAGTLCCMTYVFYERSCSHFNPAITLGHIIANRNNYDDLVEMLIAMATQCGGALGGGFLVWAVFQEPFAFEPGKGYEWWQVMIVEASLTGRLAISE
eukprot:GHVN01091804.1.p1 GENE.GHVN01091804.1~~GHVN01091804.1.p1  ORF type:complete len:140 (+),score=9.19 GHVN01091804.1:31-450(+)